MSIWPTPMNIIMDTDIMFGVPPSGGRDRLKPELQTTTTIITRRNRTFAEIKKLIGRSKLSAWVKKKSVAVFQRIAEAEGKIHGLPPGEGSVPRGWRGGFHRGHRGRLHCIGDAGPAARAGCASHRRHRLGGLRARTFSRSRPRPPWPSSAPAASG